MEQTWDARGAFRSKHSLSMEAARIELLLKRIQFFITECKLFLSFELISKGNMDIHSWYTIEETFNYCKIIWINLNNKQRPYIKKS